MSMLGHLVHTRDAVDMPLYIAPRNDGWVKRALRALFGKREQSAH
jgi:hypothetical protein